MKVKLNLGCGPHAMKGWLNYDVDPGLNRMDIVPFDLSLGKLPHTDSSVDFIFSEHFIEHITRDQGLKLLKECYRVLKPGGVLRLSTPDLETLIRSYMNWLHMGELPDKPEIWHPKSPCAMVNEGMRYWGHQYLYDRHDLENVLVEAGFDRFDIDFVVIRESAYPELHGLEVRPLHMEMIVEVVKN